MRKTMTTKPTKFSLEKIPVRKFIDDYIYRIDVDADYQREKIWSIEQQEKLLDSIINDIDIPKIYLVKVEDNNNFDYECIDGKQRMTTLLRFFKPEPAEKFPVKIRFLQEKYTYKELKRGHPTIAKKIDDFDLSFCVYESIDDKHVREIFRRLQLGIRLNSGELLKTRTGTIRDFIYKEIGNDGPFFRNTNLSQKRFSRPFTLSQICINSFTRAKSGEFVRARLQDIQDFFDENHDLNRNNENLVRIREVLNKMDRAFKKDAPMISSRAVAVSAYLFAEELFLNKKTNLITSFSEFYSKLLSEIKNNMGLLRNFERPKNSCVMEEFQKYILQASVEGYSVKRRHDFLKEAFDYYRAPKTRGKIKGDK